MSKTGVHERRTGLLGALSPRDRLFSTNSLAQGWILLVFKYSLANNKKTPNVKVATPLSTRPLQKEFFYRGYHIANSNAVSMSEFHSVRKGRSAHDPFCGRRRKETLNRGACEDFRCSSSSKVGLLCRNRGAVTREQKAL